MAAGIGSIGVGVFGFAGWVWGHVGGGVHAVDCAIAILFGGGGRIATGIAGGIGKCRRTRTVTARRTIITARC